MAFERLKKDVGKVKAGISKLKKYQGEMKAKELQRLKQQRLKLEGDVRLKTLKEKELSRIKSARSKLGTQESFFNLQMPKESPSMNLEGFSLTEPKKKKSRSMFGGF